MSSYQAKTLSPIVPVADMARSITFYQEMLGFTVSRQSSHYSILTKDTASLHLALADGPSVLETVRGHISFYLQVQSIEALWSHVSHFQDRYKIRAIFDREYGMREFHIIDPDDCLIFVGERIEAAANQDPTLPALS